MLGDTLNEFKTSSRIFRTLAGIISLISVVALVGIFRDFPEKSSIVLQALLVISLLYFSFGMAVVAFRGRFKFLDFIDNIKQFRNVGK